MKKMNDKCIGGWGELNFESCNIVNEAYEERREQEKLAKKAKINKHIIEAEKAAKKAKIEKERKIRFVKRIATLITFAVLVELVVLLSIKIMMLS